MVYPVFPYSFLPECGIIKIAYKEGVNDLNYQELVEKRDRYQAERTSIPEYTLQSYEQAFEIEYTHNSTAIEGNTLTLIETKVLLEDGISVGGKHLRELYEAVNHRNAYRYVKECIEKGPLKLPVQTESFSGSDRFGD